MAGGGCSIHSRYRAGCPGCRRVGVAYDRRRRGMIKAGKWQPPVPVGEVSDHVHRLHAAGMSYRRIAAVAGVSPNTVYVVAHRLRPTLHGPTAAALMAVSTSPALPAGMVEAFGTTRRIRALVAIGYTLTDIACRLDRHIQQIWEWAWGRQPTLTATHAAAVADLFEQLSATPGPSVRARNDGRRRGWFPPLAWDDIDDPAAEPHADPQASEVIEADWVVVDRALQGKPVDLNALERHHAVHRGVARGMSVKDIAEALRLPKSTVSDLSRRPLPDDCEVAA